MLDVATLREMLAKTFNAQGPEAGCELDDEGQGLLAATCLPVIYLRTAHDGDAARNGVVGELRGRSLVAPPPTWRSLR